MKEYHVCQERLELKTPRHSYWSENDVIDQWNRESDHEPELLCSTDSLEHARMVYDSLSTANHSLGNRLYTTVDLYSIEEVELDDDGEELQAITLDMKTDTVGYRYLADFEGDKLVIDEDSDEDAEIAFQGLFAEHLRDAFEGGKTPDDIDLWDIRLSDRDAGWEVTIEDVLGGSKALAREVGIIYTAAKEETK